MKKSDIILKNELRSKGYPEIFIKNIYSLMRVYLDILQTLDIKEEKDKRKIFFTLYEKVIIKCKSLLSSPIHYYPALYNHREVIYEEEVSGGIVIMKNCHCLYYENLIGIDIIRLGTDFKKFYLINMEDSYWYRSSWIKPELFIRADRKLFAYSPYKCVYDVFHYLDIKYEVEQNI